MFKFIYKTLLLVSFTISTRKLEIEFSQNSIWMYGLFSPCLILKPQHVSSIVVAWELILFVFCYAVLLQLQAKLVEALFDMVWNNSLQDWQLYFFYFDQL